MHPDYIVRMTHGSHLYGTNIETSDLDIKSVVFPTYNQIFLGDVNWSRVIGQDSSRPNTKDDIDDERHDLLRFLHLLETGHPIALEMLFAPDSFHLEKAHPVWQEIRDNKDLIISRNVTKILRYCCNQATNYGNISANAESTEKVLGLINKIILDAGQNATLRDYITDIINEVPSPHIAEEFRKTSPKTQERFLKIGNKLVPSTAKLHTAKAMCENIIADYKQRMLPSDQWSQKKLKALSHAVRIGNEAAELLQTGNITLPRPEAPYLIKIRRGEVHPDKVGEEVLEILEDINRSYASSSLRENPDEEFINNLIVQTYGEYAMEAFQYNKRDGYKHI